MGNGAIVPAADQAGPPTERGLQGGGSVPQVAHTYAYFTKVGGYASINEHQGGTTRLDPAASGLSAYASRSFDPESCPTTTPPPPVANCR